MSELGILSQEFNENSNLLHDLNEATIKIKKHFYNLESISEGTFQELSNFINDIIKQVLAQGNKTTDEYNPMFFYLYQEMLKNHSLNQMKCNDNLNICMENLVKGYAFLTESNIDLLDQMSAILDDSSQIYFRKMVER